ncbi:MAG TPA: MarR family transcriptional regulator [Vicinamibacterales bacterium]|jgi:DNA-binding MarR family transcriptional regulator
MARRTSPKTPDAVADAIHSASIHLLRKVRKEDDRTGITPSRLSALSVLVFGGPMRMTDLARAEHVKPPTMTRIVAALEAGRLARRRSDAADGRSARIEATRRGARLMQEGRKRRVVRLGDALKALSDQDLAVLARAAEIIETVANTI